MKRLLLPRLVLAILLLGCCYAFSQNVASSISDSTKNIVSMTAKAGSCASPDGGMNATAIAPPSYAWLQANGYCNPAAYGNNPTVCWTFTPTSSSVTINSGYSQTGCNNIAFGGFNLYNNSCTLLGSGLSFTGLTPGQQYTWCLSGSAWGGGPSCTGFDDFCPYYTNNVVLPIELEIFDGINADKYNYIHWVTATEINNDYFILKKSRDGIYWEDIATISGSGSTNTPSMYSYKDYKLYPGANYYQLTQFDYNGESETFDMISVIVDYTKESPVPYDVLGNIIKHPNQFVGMIVYKYSDGNSYKVIKLK